MLPNGRTHDDWTIGDSPSYYPVGYGNNGDIGVVVDCQSRQHKTPIVTTAEKVNESGDTLMT